jgi:hypothetical protein
MKSFLFIFKCFLALGLNACTDQSSYQTISFFVNETNHTIIIKGYENGIFNSSLQQSISPNQKLLLYTDKNDGKGRGFVYPVIIIGGLDSLVVEFDFIKKSTHNNSILLSGNNPKAIVFTNERNIFNENNWVLNTTKNTRRRLESEFTYTFTEKDFELAY